MLRRQGCPTRLRKSLLGAYSPACLCLMCAGRWALGPGHDRPWGGYCPGITHCQEGLDGTSMASSELEGAGGDHGCWSTTCYARSKSSMRVGRSTENWRAVVVTLVFGQEPAMLAGSKSSVQVGRSTENWRAVEVTLGFGQEPAMLARKQKQCAGGLGGGGSRT